MNPLKKALQKDEVELFILGQREYYYLNRDWGEHDFSDSWYYMREFAKQEGEQKLYTLLNSYLLKLLQEDKNDCVVFATMRYLWSYFVYRKREHDLKSDWNISDDLVRNLRSRIRSLKSAKKHQESEIHRIKNQLRDQFHFTI